MRYAKTKILALLIALALLALAACSGQSETGDTAVGIGTVSIVSGGKTYAPLENWINSLNSDGVAADGAGIQPDEVVNELEAIPYGDDFGIVIDGEPHNGPYYTLYNSNFEEAYYRGDAFSAPNDAGIYILIVDVSWGNEKAYEGYQYCFKLEVADMLTEPDIEPPMEPVDNEPVEAPPFPGLPVYVDNEEWLEQEKEREQQAIDDPDAPPQEATGGPLASVIFDHYDDPPPDGAVRLVHVYNYGDTEAVLVDDVAEVSAILDMVKGFKLSDYNGGPMLGGYLVNIQAVIDGVHQSYSVMSLHHNGSYIVSDGRNVDNWYETGEENLEMLMRYFGEPATAEPSDGLPNEYPELTITAAILPRKAILPGSAFPVTVTVKNGGDKTISYVQGSGSYTTPDALLIGADGLQPVIAKDRLGIHTTDFVTKNLAPGETLTYTVQVMAIEPSRNFGDYTHTLFNEENIYIAELAWADIKGRYPDLIAAKAGSYPGTFGFEYAINTGDVAAALAGPTSYAVTDITINVTE